jgi:DNA primase
LKKRGISDEMVERMKLGYDEKRAAITIPYFSKSGKCMQVRYRNLFGEPKYLSEEGAKVMLYNISDVRSPEVYICEGEFDTITLLQLGKKAVGVPGTNAFKPYWRWLFMDCSKVNIVYDGDDAGRKGADMLVRYLSHVPELRVIRMPEGEDVNSLMLKDEERLRRLLG